MSDTYALPVEGYQQPPVDPMGYALPVAQPIPADIPRVYIRPEPDVIPTRDEPILHTSGKQLKAIDHDPWANLGMAGVEDKSGQSEHPLLKQLFGLGGEDRVQLWPERMVRAGVTAAGNVMSDQTPQWAVDPVTGDVHTSPQMIEAGLDTAALAGTGGLAGTTEATLGSGPFLRPALKHNGKIYKGKEGQQHLDVLPKELEADFNQKAMTGEDISHYNFGFMNHKGQFLNREAALDYAVKEGLIDPTAGQYGALTSTLLSDSSKPGIAIEAMKKPTFYSALEHNVNNIGQAKMTGDQWLGTLANKPGVKPEELQWTGLKEFMEENKGRSISKEQIQQHLEQNKVELKEVVKQAPQDEVAKGRAMAESQGHNWDNLSNVDQNRYVQTANGRKLTEEQPTKYHGYQLPGGENYREMLMTLPGKPKGLPTEAQYKALDAKFGTGEQLTSKEMELHQNYERMLNGLPNRDDVAPYKSSHWDEPNILAHVRMNDRTIEGKKSLHLEEIQSDWHQQGREQGYKGVNANNKNIEVPEGVNAAADPRLWDKSETGVPDAPFKKTWHELALKRMLREAAEKGYDRLSWTPGEAQAARYDLSKQIDTLKATPVQDQHGLKYEIQAVGKGTMNPIHQFATEAELPNIVGKEMAKKIVEETGGKKSVNYTGLDLKIGGEGMKGFYDKMIPQSLEKMGKEHGVKVKQSEINSKYVLKNKYGITAKGGDTLEEANQSLRYRPNQEDWKVEKESNPVHYIDIPQSLKDTVLRKGQPLFAAGVPLPLMPIDHDPWEKKNATKEK